jgi:hypothetical protein
MMMMMSLQHSLELEICYIPVKDGVNQVTLGLDPAILS